MGDSGDRRSDHGFLGRTAVRAELDRLLVNDSTDRWVVLTGGRGMGKSAIAAGWLARREAAHDFVPRHFVCRQQGDRVEPSTVARSLAAQIEERYPSQRDRYARPEARLAGLLSRVSAHELAPRGARMVLLIDGLDERHPASDLREVLAYLPRALPPGVRVLCVGRHGEPERDGFEGRLGQLARLDLDDPSLAEDNDATVRALWRGEAPGLGLDDRFIEHAVGRAGGNVLHAAVLRSHLAGLPHAERSAQAIPRGLPALLEVLWRRVAGDPSALRALGILCAAREPLSLEQLARVAGWSDPSEPRAVVQVVRALVVEVRRDHRASAYRLFHDAIRSFLVEQLGPVAIRDHHRALADTISAWPAPRDAAARGYALRYAIGHRIAAGDCRATHALASDVDFLEAKCNELGVDDVELDVRRAAEACLAAGDFVLAHELDGCAREVARTSSALRDDPGARTAQVWSGLRQTRRGPGEVKPRPTKAGGAGASVPRRPVRSPGVPALLSELVLHGSGLTACAVTLDGRRVIAAFSDHSLEVWDLDSGRLLNTLIGHTGSVASCKMTLEGRRFVSASADSTLKVWDLDTGRVLATLEGHTGMVESCAIIPDGRRVVSASADSTLRVWDLDTGRVLAAFEAHTEAVTDCAVTPDGRRLVSASADTTLKIWDLDTGDLITTFAGHAGKVASCCVTPDGRRVISGGGDHTLKVWDVDSGRVITTLEGHTGAVASCVVAPDGRSLYSASCDATLRIWDLETGRGVTTLERHAGPVTCCAVTPDGRRLVAGSACTLAIWDLDGSRAPTVLGYPAVLPAATGPARVGAASEARARPPASRHIILFLAANPKDTSRLLLQEECAAIERELQMARHGDDFEFRSKWAVTVDEMARHLIALEPTIIHFSGRGASGRPGDSGIHLHDEHHGEQVVSGRALALMVKSAAPSVRVVVLNACYSDGHAEALCPVVECVVGMSRAIHEHAARSFAVAFYRALGNRRSVGNAVDHVTATLAAKQLPDDSIPRCRTRNWVDAHEIVL